LGGACDGGLLVTGLAAMTTSTEAVAIHMRGFHKIFITIARP